MKKLLSMFLACVLLLGILPTSAWAADSVEAALGEVDIYNGGYELGYTGYSGDQREKPFCDPGFVPRRTSSSTTAPSHAPKTERA